MPALTKPTGRSETSSPSLASTIHFSPVTAAAPAVTTTCTFSNSSRASSSGASGASPPPPTLPLPEGVRMTLAVESATVSDHGVAGAEATPKAQGTTAQSSIMGTEFTM